MDLAILANLIAKSSSFKYTRDDTLNVIKELDNHMQGFYAFKIIGETIYVY